MKTEISISKYETMTNQKRLEKLEDWGCSGAEVREGEWLSARASSLDTHSFITYYFILIISPLVPSCSRAPCETDRKCKMSPS